MSERRAGPPHRASTAHSSAIRGSVAVALVIVLFGLTVLAQVVRDRTYSIERAQDDSLYLRSGQALARLALSFDAVLADLYWIRAIQHYGAKKLSTDTDKQYDLLYPLLDIATTLDPRFNVAYRFGAIFLAEAYPDGPGRPDQAIALLEKGFAAMPEKWQYLMDIGFIHYWWLHDYIRAAEMFERASEVPGASWWLEPLAANTLVAGGQRDGSRLLWGQILESAEHEWLRRDAARRLAQLTALDQIDRLEAELAAYEAEAGRRPESWQVLIADGRLAGVPVDPTGVPYRLRQPGGTVTVSPDSSLFPLPGEPPPKPAQPVS